MTKDVFKERITSILKKRINPKPNATDKIMYPIYRRFSFYFPFVAFVSIFYIKSKIKKHAVSNIFRDAHSRNAPMVFAFNRKMSRPWFDIQWRRFCQKPKVLQNNSPSLYTFFSLQNFLLLNSFLTEITTLFS